MNEFVLSQNGKVRISRDGTVQINPDSDTAHIDVLEVSRHPKGYNQYAINGWGFQAYKSAAYQLWPKRPWIMWTATGRTTPLTICGR